MDEMEEHVVGKAGGGEEATATFFVRERQEVSGACALWVCCTLF